MKKFCPEKLSSFVGFTLIELLVVMAIMGILFGVGVAQYTSFNRRQILEQASRDLINNLRLAQTKAANGEKPAECTSTLEGYQVNFSLPRTYQIQAKCGGNLVGTPNVFNLPSVVEFSSLPSPSEVLFKVLAQGTDLNSDLTITLAAFGKTKTITVTKQGKIE